jgi:hypothetical protein
MTQGLLPMIRLAALFCLLAVPAAAGCAKPAEIHFAAGASSAVVEGGLARGDRDCFTIAGRAGQTLAVTQPDPVDDNIVFQLYAPPWTVRHTEDGWAMGGKTLAGAGETDDAAQFSGALPVGGRYLIVVGTTRGGGTYRLRVAIK